MSIKTKKKSMNIRTERAINMLLDAFNEGTLAAGTCVACAVGNLIARSSEVNIVKMNDNINFDCLTVEGKPFDNTSWFSIFRESTIDNYDREMIKKLSRTGFSIEELKKIETIFEENSKINFTQLSDYQDEEIKKDQITALGAVIRFILSLDNPKEGEDSFDEKDVNKYSADNTTLFNQHDAKPHVICSLLTQQRRCFECNAPLEKEELFCGDCRRQ